ncbi:MAG: cupin domain-containing protein [Pseudomonadota bacterium]
MLKSPALDPALIEAKIGSGYPQPFKASTSGRAKRMLTAALGLSQFGVNVTEIDPDSATSLRHWHSHEDEFIYVLDGEVTLVTDGGSQVLTKGMCAGFPAGVEDGHCIENRSGKPATILEVGSRDDRDEGNYPDVDLHCQPNRYKEAIFTRKDGTPY